MLDSIEIKISNKVYIPFVLSAFDQLRTRLFQTNLEPVKEALQILLNNVIEHAFEQPYEIDLRVRFLVQSCELRIDVEDNGLPFDFTPYLSQEITQKYEHQAGLYRIYQLVDRFEYKHLGKHGKRLSLVQYFNLCYDLKSNTVSSEAYDKDEVLQGITIRRFEKGDGDGIAKLIYRNYNFSYYKDIFYIPHKVREANLDKSVTSIVAYYKRELIGHFALVRSKHSNIAEIGVATVDPRFKRMGIMNLMFDELIITAKKEEFKAIYGEALTMHPFSQKANLRHGMVESAICLGLVPETMEIEKNIKSAQRSGAMIAYLLFDPTNRELHLPTRYKEELLKVYQRAGLQVTASHNSAPQRKALDSRTNPMLNSGTLVVEDVFELHDFTQKFESLRHQKLDMIFADINLHHIKDIDKIIQTLNDFSFFYSGLLFEYYFNEDYLRMQYVNSLDIDMEGIICYSDDANAMIDFIREDYKSVVL